MKKRILFIVIVLFFFVFTRAQTMSEVLDDKDRTVCWFELSFEIITVQETGFTHIEIKEVNDEIIQGTIKEFGKALFKNLKNDLFSIGYFNKKTEAEEALKLYKSLITIKESEKRIIETDVFPERVYWYVSEPRKKKDKWYISRGPAAITKGSINDFYETLFESVFMSVLIIGPYVYGETAEDSKRIYRLKSK